MGCTPEGGRAAANKKRTYRRLEQVDDQRPEGQLLEQAIGACFIDIINQHHLYDAQANHRKTVHHVDGG